MRTRVYLRDWFYNAGIIGFLRILDNAGDNFADIKENYIEFNTEKLKNFDTYYFKYFFDKYNVADRIKGRIEKSFKIIEFNLEKEPKDKQEEKQIKEEINKEKKDLKSYIKIQLDKIKKVNESIYNEIFESFQELDMINKKEDISSLQNIKDNVLNNFYKEEINNRLTLNSFKYVLSRGYFGQPSFLNVCKSVMDYEQQKSLFFKDYVSNVIEENFIKEFLNDKYNTEEIEDYLKNKGEILSKKIEKEYANILKLLKKRKNNEDIKRYIKEKMVMDCCMCDNKDNITENYSERHFAPLAISSEGISNFFWNQKVDIPICSICKLILFCIPAGITSITKTVKEYRNNKYCYNEKEILSFVNYDTNVENLMKVNNNFGINSKKENYIENPYSNLIFDIIKQEKEISQWKLQNIFVVEFESEYGAFSRIEYFNIKKYVAIFFKNYSNSTLNCIKDYKYKLQIVDGILKNKDIDYIIYDRLRGAIKEEDVFCGFNSFLATKTRLIINLLKKGGNEMQEIIEKSNKKINVLYNLGIEIHEELKAKGEENKLSGYEYRMLNTIKAGNKKEFMDIVIRIHISMGKNISPIFIEIMQDGKLDLSSIGHSFVAGLVSDRYEKNN